MNNSVLYSYCHHPLAYRRRVTREVRVGGIGIGADNPIRIQSMTTSPTMDTESTVQQIIALYKAGCEIVRLTVPSIREAENLKWIHERMKREGVAVPLVADIHYTPNAALKAVEFVEKIRINPGNFADKKQLTHMKFTDAEYQRELERVDEMFRPLVERCRELGVAMRIGVNHGSLSDRIMSRYGDTPAGMVESAVEFIQIAERYGYQDIVLSMKASNPKIMIAAYRMLAARLAELDTPYPFHLGVTEAGEGEDGRVKSAVGIGSLLEDGIGDTIRVSLTEDSVNEIPAARAIAEKYHHSLPVFSDDPPNICESRNPFDPVRRTSSQIRLGKTEIGGHHPVAVIYSPSWPVNTSFDEGVRPFFELPKNPRPEAIRLNARQSFKDSEIQEAYNSAAEHSMALVWACRETENDCLRTLPYGDVFSVFSDPNIDESAWNKQLQRITQKIAEHEKTIEFYYSRMMIPDFLTVKYRDRSDRLKYMIYQYLKTVDNLNYRNYYFMVSDPALVYMARYLVSCLDENNIHPPLGLLYSANQYSPDYIQTAYHAPVLLGSLLSDGIGDLVCIEDSKLGDDASISLIFNILQASRARISKAEWISCPSCGRTQFDIQAALARIKSKTGHLTGVKIAVMGCVVNGLGEMADADFGFVGAQPGKVNLYFGKTLVRRNIDMNDADRQLIDLIKEYGYWKEPVA